jgi:hypothetical protein
LKPDWFTVYLHWEALVKKTACAIATQASHWCGAWAVDAGATAGSCLHTVCCIPAKGGARDDKEQTDMRNEYIGFGCRGVPVVGNKVPAIDNNRILRSAWMLTAGSKSNSTLPITPHPWRQAYCESVGDLLRVHVTSPTLYLQGVSGPLYVSGGYAPEVPLHVSGSSQTPAAALRYQQYTQQLLLGI